MKYEIYAIYNDGYSFYEYVVLYRSKGLISNHRNKAFSDIIFHYKKYPHITMRKPFDIDVYWFHFDNKYPTFEDWLSANYPDCHYKLIISTNSINNLPTDYPEYFI